MLTKEEEKHLQNIRIINPLSKKGLTSGQKAADFLTKWVGSWTFISLFTIFLILWICVNVYFLSSANKPSFDPYPFILLNLVLACLTAFQVPIILMSQNRENERDRVRTEYDYAVDRKAEKEIREVKDSLEKIKSHLRIR